MSEENWFYTYRPGADFTVTDEDAAEFLQSQFSNELQPFEPDRATYGLWLDVKGKVLGDSLVLCRGESDFRVHSERSDGSGIRAHLERHIIADDVVIDPVEGSVAFALSAEACAALGMTLPAKGRFVESALGLLSNAPDASYQLLVEGESAAEGIKERLVASGSIELTEDARGLRRIDTGCPLVPEEIGSADLPGEGGLEGFAISFTKGCFLGQEVVARMHNLGQAQRRLFIVEGAGAKPDLPLPVFRDGQKQVGEVRSAYQTGAGWRGVALLKRRFVEPGDRLATEADTIDVLRALN